MRRRLPVFLLVAVFLLLPAAYWLIVRDSPHDLRIASPTQLTISPDADGDRDSAPIEFTSSGNGNVRLVVWTWGGRSSGWKMTVRTPSVPVHSGNNTMVWHGRNSAGNPVKDRAYVVAICGAPRWRWVTTARRRIGVSLPTDSKPVRATQQDSDEMSDPKELARAERSASNPPWTEDDRCTKPVHVQVNRLKLAVAGGSVTPGQTVQLTTGAERMHIELVRDGREAQAPVASWDVADTPTIELPQTLQTGLYHLVATKRGVSNGAPRTFPLIVQSGGALNQPPQPHTALIVWNSLTWQAYSTYDGDNNGIPDSWYQLWSQRRAPLDQPVQPVGWEHGHDAARHFSQWLWNRPANHVQTIADRDLELIPQNVLNRYDAIVFPGHSEYFTRGMYDKVMDYTRNGGDVMLFNANSFYREVELQPDDRRMELVHLVGTCPQCHAELDGKRTDFQLFGLGYSGCCAEDGFGRYTVKSTNPQWLFRDLPFSIGTKFGRSGTEVDAVNSPPDIDATVVAMSKLDGVRGNVPVHMVHATVKGGGQIFAGGSYEFLNMSDRNNGTPVLSTLLDNLWANMVEGSS
jgi:hypothetical protein